MYEWCNKDICLFENDKAIEALNYLKKISEVYLISGLKECPRCRRTLDKNFSANCQARMKTVFELFGELSEISVDSQQYKVKRIMKNKKIGLPKLKKWKKKFF